MWRSNVIVLLGMLAAGSLHVSMAKRCSNDDTVIGGRCCAGSDVPPPCAIADPGHDRFGFDIDLPLEGLTAAQCYQACVSHVVPKCKFFTYGSTTDSTALFHRRCYLKTEEASVIIPTELKTVTTYDVTECTKGMYAYTDCAKGKGVCQPTAFGKLRCWPCGGYNQPFCTGESAKPCKGLRPYITRRGTCRTCGPPSLYNYRENDSVCERCGTDGMPECVDA